MSQILCLAHMGVVLCEFCGASERARKTKCVRWKTWTRLLSMWLVVGFEYIYSLICVESFVMSSKLCL